MTLIPYIKKEIRTYLDKDNIILQLENIIEPIYFLNIDFYKTDKLFKGYLKKSHFKIKLSHINTYLGNFSPPIIIGKIETNIIITIRPSIWDLLFYTFLVGMIVMIYYSKSYYGIMVVPILLISFMIIVFNYYSKKSLEILLRYLGKEAE